MSGEATNPRRRVVNAASRTPAGTRKTRDKRMVPPATPARGADAPARSRGGASVSKLSVSLPDVLAASVRERVGPGRFSAYVTSAVERQLALDRLAELVAGIEEGLGHPIPAELMAEAEAAWHAE